eukprot:CAMPEP_0172758992 /NCGR_PEP_ID=MMETSP1074-20121228/166810_1 /TAXON_ID=2916 /ORGANISM="Ceratium fusus, Strain PA161109" /LENGTH=131 /DNA_ID=CAMNT_0013592683 /DNA_START=309 /DNA_END=705 /DNA_ORIENTATION=-
MHHQFAPQNSLSCSTTGDVAKAIPRLLRAHLTLTSADTLSWWQGTVGTCAADQVAAEPTSACPIAAGDAALPPMARAEPSRATSSREASAEVPSTEELAANSTGRGLGTSVGVADCGGLPKEDGVRMPCCG